MSRSWAGCSPRSPRRACSSTSGTRTSSCTARSRRPSTPSSRAPTFNGRAYYLSLVREVLIEGKVPASWLRVAQQIAPSYPALDLGKLSFLSKGTQPVDSFHFTLDALRRQYDLEVHRATAANKGSAFGNFKDDYTDRMVAWGGLVLADLKIEEAPRAQGGRGVRFLRSAGAGRRAAAPAGGSRLGRVRTAGAQAQEEGARWSPSGHSSPRTSTSRSTAFPREPACWCAAGCGT